MAASVSLVTKTWPNLTMEICRRNSLKYGKFFAKPLDSLVLFEPQKSLTASFAYWFLALLLAILELLRLTC